MSRYDNLQQYKNLSDSEKVSFLRMEMIPLIAGVKGYAALMKHHIETDENILVPEDFKKWLDKVIDSAEDIEKLRQLLIED